MVMKSYGDKKADYKELQRRRTEKDALSLRYRQGASGFVQAQERALQDFRSSRLTDSLRELEESK